MEPISLSVFLEDPKVTDIIEKGMGTVYLAGGSEGTADNGKIIVEPNKYYMVEDWGLNPWGKEEPDNIGFVAASGTRVNSLNGIGRLNGREITGLTNDYTYFVRSATALTGKVSYNSNDESINNGVVTIYKNSSPTEIDLSTTNNIGGGSTWLCVKVSSNGTVEDFTFTNNKITLDNVKTTNDYIFYESTTRVFYFLRVIVEQAGLNITITPYVYQGELTFSLSSVSIAHTTIIDNSYNINVTAAAIANATIVGWSYEGTPITSSATLTKGLIASETGIDFSVRGSYEFTYTVTIGNPAVPYNGTLTINVTPLP